MDAVTFVFVVLSASLACDRILLTAQRPAVACRMQCVVVSSATRPIKPPNGRCIAVPRVGILYTVRRVLCRIVPGKTRIGIPARISEASLLPRPRVARRRVAPWHHCLLGVAWMDVPWEASTYHRKPKAQDCAGGRATRKWTRHTPQGCTHTGQSTTPTSPVHEGYPLHYLCKILSFISMYYTAPMYPKPAATRTKPLVTTIPTCPRLFESLLGNSGTGLGP
jgi:hypothetical protein